MDMCAAVREGNSMRDMCRNDYGRTGAEKAIIVFLARVRPKAAQHGAVIYLLSARAEPCA